MSTRLQERVAQQSLADNLPAVSQPAQSEPLDVGAPTSMDYITTNEGPRTEPCGTSTTMFSQVASYPQN